MIKIKQIRFLEKDFIRIYSRSRYARGMYIETIVSVECCYQSQILPVFSWERARSNSQFLPRLRRFQEIVFIMLIGRRVKTGVVCNL